jgi:hypothetical protein
MLDLKTRVNLQEIKRLREAIINKLYGSGRSIVDGFAETDGNFEESFADGI